MRNPALAFVFVISLGLQPSLFGQAQRKSPPSIAKPTTVPLTVRALRLYEVLGWRTAYEDLLDKDIAVAKERYGPPDHENERFIDYDSSNGRTEHRSLRFLVEDGKVRGVSVGPPYQDYTDNLDVTEVLIKAPLFCFSSGTYTDTTQNVFQAKSRDGRNLLLFGINEDGNPPYLFFDRVIFENVGSPCDPSREAPAKQ